MKGKIFACCIYLSFLIQIFAQENLSKLDFYGIVTSGNIEIDLARPIQDLYYSYLNEQNIYELVDKRNEIYDETAIKSSNFIFYIELNLINTHWVSIIYLIAPSNFAELSNQKKTVFDSYNKLLVDIKPSVQAFFSAKTASQRSHARTNLTLESFAGNWNGEDFIDRIVLLRPGRGFIFFKGGASMPVTIMYRNNQLRIIQSGKSNASFYPDIPRSLALTTALTAEPIEWTFTALTENRIEGEKRTLKTVYQDGVAVAVEKVAIPVIWEKVN
ncbi:MAG: TP0183 family DNA metabolism protein [Treponemataceae bacterium]